jgi:hypothetical protein
MKAPNANPSALKNFFNRITDNPIITKELKGRMRGLQGVIYITVYLSLISFFIALVYLLANVDGSLSNADPDFMQEMGKIIFSTVILLELLMIGFIGPALTSGSIATEREHKTIDLLKTSLLSASAIIFGKISSAVAFLLLLILAAVPLQSMAFFLGGVGMAEIVVSTLMLVVTAIFFCALGLFFSSFATVFSYSTLLISFILFILLLLFADLLDTEFGCESNVRDAIGGTILWILLSSNPFFAAILSETILVDEQSLYLTHDISMFFGCNHLNLALPSPWIIYVTLYTLLTVALVSLSIYFVKRPER